MKGIERVIFWGAVGLGGYVLYKTINPDKYKEWHPSPDGAKAIRNPVEGELVTSTPSADKNKIGEFLKSIGIGTGKRKKLKIAKRAGKQRASQIAREAVTKYSH